MGIQNGAATLEDSLVVAYKIQHTLTVWSNLITFRGIYPKELKTYVHTKTCIWLFIAALFIIARLGKCPSASKWINKLVHSDKGTLLMLKGNAYEAIKRHGRNLSAYFKVKKISQTEKATGCMIPVWWHSARQNYGESKNISGCQ